MKGRILHLRPVDRRLPQPLTAHAETCLVALFRYLVIGAYGDDENRESVGAAIVFVRDGSGSWQQQARLIAAD